MIRKPAVAGRFYPSDASALSKWLKNAFESVESENADRSNKNSEIQKARGCVAPHAGYIYSGKTAVDAIASLEFADTYILIGPNHTGIGTPASISTADWETPLGIVSFDKELLHYFDGSIAVPDETAHRREHSLEVQLPVLQEKFRRAGKPVDSFKIFPICMGYQDPQTAFEIGSIIREIMRNESEVGSEGKNSKKIAILATSDFSHYISASAAENIDLMLIEKIISGDICGFYKTIDEYDASLCGYGPISAMIIALEKDSGSKVSELKDSDSKVSESKASETNGRPRPAENGIHLLSYTNSGEVSGDFDAVVGYAAISVR